MKLGVAFVAVLSPLIITPGVLFSFDITPKIAALTLGTWMMLWFCKENVNRIRAMLATRFGGWFVALLAAQWMTVAMAAALSSSPAVSLNGSSWRRYGLLTQTCVMLGGLLAAAWISEDRARLRTVLRMCAGAGAVSALYGIFQYFGWDPLLNPKAYQAGQGQFMIVRPPGTLGHADYFGAWLTAVFFAGWALAGMEETRWGRRAARTTTVLAAAAMLLSGTRAALLGLAVGIAVLAWMRRPRMSVRAAAVAACGTAALAVFFFSPAGARLRARAHWSIEDTWGGARLLLWRDSLTMAAHRPWTGYGPETFSSEFPHFQSLELARAFPDFYHESPHNIFLDALTAGGAAGLAATLALAILGFFAYWRLGERHAAPLVAGWAAFVAANQFMAFTAPTAAYFYLWLAMLAGGACAAEPRAARPASRGSRAAYPLSAAVGLIVAVYALRMVAADAALAHTRRAIEAGDVQRAADAYRFAIVWQPGGWAADLYYSRGMAELATRSDDPAVRVQARQQALEAGVRATRFAEDRQNAWYNLAALLATQNDAAGAEQCLRNAIAAAPNWFKPHWTLARLLVLSHRDEEALAQASAAVERNGGRNAEVFETWNRLQREHAAKP